MNILYISYDGMTDNLGQSQVLPYLYGLARKNFKISILSAEKADAFKNNGIAVFKQTQAAGIEWHYVTYSAKPPVLSTLLDLYKMRCKAKKLIKEKAFNLIHCRSYISAMLGLYFKKKYHIPFVFDMRGFWADERVEGGIWNLKNPLYRAIFQYFKNKEQEFFLHTSHVVCLTKKGQDIVDTWLPKHNPPPVSVIPCCVDTDLFDRENVGKEKTLRFKNELGLDDNHRIISYLGSLGTWYMPGEMMEFFKLLHIAKNAYRFLFITPDKPEDIFNLAVKYGVDKSCIIVRKASREDVPALLGLSEVSVFFIKPVFSKKASSPTKQAEVLSMGIPIICNEGIGDTGDIIRANGAGIVIDSFTQEAYKQAIKEIDFIKEKKAEVIRKIALDLFSLEKGVDAYAEIYRRFEKK